MTQQLEVPYAVMVEKLWKLDTIPMQYLHAGIGVIGEIVELYEAERKGPPEHSIIEELGDIAFYLQKMLAWNNLELEMFYEVPKDFDAHLLTDAGELLDCCKRFGIYNKQFESERFNRHLIRLTTCFFAKLRLHQYTLLDVQIANQRKLLTGEKARYKLGLYTDEQANARQDKTA